MVSGKLKVNLGVDMVKYGCDLLRPGTLKSALSQFKNKLMNWAVSFACWKWWNYFKLDH